MILRSEGYVNNQSVAVWNLFQIKIQINSSASVNGDIVTIPNHIGWLGRLWPFWSRLQAHFCIPNPGEYGPLVVVEKLESVYGNLWPANRRRSRSF